MVNTVRSLDVISTGYSIFEKDQVLTADKLNTVADYLDDQGRLTRVCLLGVGPVCGLRASLQGTTVLITKGVGVTTDGDLLRIQPDTVFDHFKAYDTSAPMYPPFFVGTTMLPLFQLIAKGTTDPAAADLSTFNASTGKDLAQMVALLLMESYVKTDDLCSGTDCDNLGSDAVNTVRVLLTDVNSAATLAAAVAAPADAFPLLHELTANRAVISSAISSTATFVAAYRAACDSTLKQLLAELSVFDNAAAGLFKDIFPTSPITGWTNRLGAVSASFAPTDGTIQYFYDFLKDLVETYNALRNCLFDERAVCCPDTTWFPKHLLLGNVVPGANPDSNRTAFYPSPLTDAACQCAGQAKFLMQKLDTLINTFKVPGVDAAIRITPSSDEDVALERRAIPFYYQFDSTKPIHRSWNYSLSLRRMEAYNYSYNAGLYNAQGGAANPFGAQIGRFPFFRVEGHLGKDVAAVTQLLQTQIQQQNLPIALHSAFVGPDVTKVVRPPFNYTDLHRIHNLIRTDVVQQLNEVDKFSGAFKAQVDAAVDSGVVRDTSPSSDGPSVKQTAETRDTAVTTNTAFARAKLSQNYSAYSQDSSWMQNVSDALSAAGSFKADLSPVVKTDFVTPFDSAIASRSILWLNWFDKIIGDKQNANDQKLLLAPFLGQHPGLEHFAGVTRGGTFVLVYDENHIVIGDLMLPYTCCEIPAPEPPQIIFDPPPVKPPTVITGGLKVSSALDKIVDDKIKVALPPVDLVTTFKGFSDSLATIKSSIEGVQTTVTQIGITRPVVTGPVATGPAVTGPIATGPAITGPVATGPITTGPAVTGPVATGPVATGPVVTGPVATGPVATGPIATGPVATGPVTTGPVVVGPIRPVVPIGDRLLNLQVRDVDTKQQKVELFREELSKPDLSPEAQKSAASQLKAAEADLARTFESTAHYISTSKMDLSEGSGAHQAMSALFSSLGSLKDAGAIKTARAGLKKVASQTDSPELKTMIDNVLK
jgi:hypothetical protein